MNFYETKYTNKKKIYLSYKNIFSFLSKIYFTNETIFIINIEEAKNHRIYIHIYSTYIIISFQDL